MKKTVIIGFLAATLSVVQATPAQEFYYGTYETVRMLRDTTKVLLQFDPSAPTPDYSIFADTVGRLTEVIPTKEAVDGFVAFGLEAGIGYDAFLDSLQSASGVLLAEPFYVTESGTPLFIGGSIIVAFEDTVDLQEIDSINALYSVSIERELQGMPGVYILRNNPSTGYRTLELANLYHNLPEARYAYPNFGMRPVQNGYKLFDYYADHQPHTKKVIGAFNSASVWDFAGLTRPVVVAVIDDGVEAHEDLPGARVLSGYDFADSTSNTDPGAFESHGMACAGIVAADHATDSLSGLLTSSGMISLNPHVLVLPVNIFGDSGNAAENPAIAEAITYASNHGAEVISNSWTWPDRHVEYPVVTEALERAALFGRGGYGCPVIQSTGNTDFYHPNPDYVRYPAWLPNSFGVGAIDLGDYRWYYSCYGSGIDIVAPSDDGYYVGVWSLDQMGSEGYNPSYVSDCPPGNNDMNYHCHFGGTSAAAPIVSGVAALLLSKDSTLSTEAIYYILENSAQRHLAWGTSIPHSLEYGEGRVDAFRAVLSISRGNVNNSADEEVDISDLMYLVNYLQLGGPAPFPTPLIADVNCDGQVDLSDLIYLTNYLFLGQAEPITPCFEFGD